MKKILITGATGFLGKYVVKLLQDKNIPIVAFGRNVEVGKKLESNNTLFFKGDIRNIDDVERASRGCDYIIHCAALSSVWGKWQDFYDVNVIGTKNILETCKKENIKRVIYISSPSVYTSPRHRLDIIESDYDDNNRLNFYIKSKIMSEDLFKNYLKESFEHVIIRPKGIFGVGDTSIIPRILRANDKVGIPLFNNGSNMLDITYVENVAHSIYLALEADNIDGETFNITNSEPMTFKNMVEMFLNNIGKKPKYLKINLKFIYCLTAIIEFIFSFLRISKEPIFTKYSIITLGYSQTLQISKAKKLLGYKPIYSISEGIKIYADWYKQNNN